MSASQSQPQQQDDYEDDEMNEYGSPPLPYAQAPYGYGAGFPPPPAPPGYPQAPAYAYTSPAGVPMAYDPASQTMQPYYGDDSGDPNDPNDPNSLYSRQHAAYGM